MARMNDYEISGEFSVLGGALLKLHSRNEAEAEEASKVFTTSGLKLLETLLLDIKSISASLEMIAQVQLSKR